MMVHSDIIVARVASRVVVLPSQVVEAEVNSPLRIVQRNVLKLLVSTVDVIEAGDALLLQVTHELLHAALLDGGLLGDGAPLAGRKRRGAALESGDVAMGRPQGARVRLN